MYMYVYENIAPPPDWKLGKVSSHDGNADENVTWKYEFAFLRYLAISQTRSTCTMWANYPWTQIVWTAFILRKRMKNCVLQKTLNLVISLWSCLFRDWKEMYPQSDCFCSLKLFFLWRLRCCCRRRCLSSIPIDTLRTRCNRLTFDLKL